MRWTGLMLAAVLVIGSTSVAAAPSQFCRVQVETRDKAIKDIGAWFEYVKRGGEPDMTLLNKNFRTAYFMIGMVDDMCRQHPRILTKNRKLKAEVDRLQRQIIDVMSGKK